MDSYLLKHLIRKPLLTVASLVFCGAICFLMCFLSTYISRQEAELLDVQENMDIQCVVTNAQGSQTTELGIRKKYIDFVISEESPFNKYVRDVQTVKLFYVDDDSDYCFSGISSVTCAEVLDPELGGFYVGDIDFMKTEDFVCIVSQSVYESLENKTLEVELYDRRSRNEDNSVRYAAFTFDVVGYYKGSGKTVYMSIATAEKVAEEIGGNFKLEEMKFYVEENTLLEEMKEVAFETFIQAKPENDRMSTDFALMFYDSNYLITVSALKQSISHTEILIPFIMLLGLGLGFIISFLATRSENRRYALMRAVGMTKGKLFFSVLREQSVIPFIVSVVIALILKAPIPALEFFLFYETGCITAVIRAVSVRPMTILRED